MTGLSPLAQYHNSVVEATGATVDGSDAAGQYDVASDTAVDLLQAVGYYDLDMVDTMGVEISDSVQTLLTLAFHLAPDLLVKVQMILLDSEI